MTNFEYQKHGKDAARANDVMTRMHMRYGWNDMPLHTMIAEGKKTGIITKEEANLLRQFY